MSFGEKTFPPNAKPLFPNLLSLGSRAPESAWLIEMKSENKPSWWTGSGWSSDANDAIRFVRQQDADKIILYEMESLMWRAVATEHQFV